MVKATYLYHVKQVDKAAPKTLKSARKGAAKTSRTVRLSREAKLLRQRLNLRRLQG